MEIQNVLGTADEKESKVLRTGRVKEVEVKEIGCSPEESSKQDDKSRKRFLPNLGVDLTWRGFDLAWI